MATAHSSTSSSVPSRPTFACVRCAERKVKCDRQRPCGACVNHKADCVFQPPRPPQRRQRYVKEQILADRLRYYEALLQEQGINTRKIPDTPAPDSRHKPSRPIVAAPKEGHPQSPHSIDSEASGTVSKTQVIHGQGRSLFVDNLWSRVVEEFHDFGEAFEDSSDDSGDSEASEDDFSFVLSSRPKSVAKSRHPPPELIHRLWQTFVENVDPLTKVLHVATVQPAMLKAASDIKAIPRSFEALMFAIYSVSVMSLSDDECKHRLYEPRTTLLSRYITATKAALSRARFMGTTSLVVLQALALHLLSVRDIYEPRAAWCLTGVAVRIAQGMGLERDGVFLGLNPFESEMRRRIWWLLKTHDQRTAELCGLPKFRDLVIGPESTKFPTNINDDQLYPGMLPPMAQSNKLTDVAFVALRYELVNFAASRAAKFRQRGKSPSEWDRDLASGGDNGETDDAFVEIEGLLEMKYLRYCDPSQPLHLITMLMARAAMNTIRFLTHHPRRWASLEQTPLPERQLVWEVSIKLLEQHNMLQSNLQLKRFAWHAAFVMQWHALIHVLDTLRADPLLEGAEKAWELLSSMYENNPSMLMDMRKPIHIAVGNLCLKAYNARASALLQKNKMCPPPVPEFVSKLRQQLQVTKAKRQARDKKRSQAEQSLLSAQSNSPKMGANNGSGPRLLNEEAKMHPSTLAQSSGVATDTDPFWFINGFDDSQAASLYNATHMDTAVEHYQSYDVDDNTSQTISWEQWDTWLSEPNVTLPFSPVRDLDATAS